MSKTPWTRIPSSVRSLAPQAALLVVALVTVSIMGVNPLSTGALYTDMVGLGYIGLIALGVGVVLILGEFDLSVGSIAAVSAVIAASMSANGLVVALVSALAASALIGLIQGIVIAVGRMSSIVVTLGSSILLAGVAQIPSNSEAIILADLSLSEPFTAWFWIFTTSSIVTLAICVVTGVVLSRTRTGRTIYALGGGKDEARSVGIPRGRYVVGGFTFSATLAGLAGAMSAFASGSAIPTGFSTLLIAGLAAALIGGVSLTGGRGTVVGIVLGVLILQVVVNGMNAIPVPYFQVNALQGALLLTYVLAQCIAGYFRNRGVTSIRQARAVFTNRRTRSDAARSASG